MQNLEIHPFLHRAPETSRPTYVIFDLDPGDGKGVLECARVALLLRDVLKDLGLESSPKVSGSKGLQIYVPLNTNITYDSTQRFARTLAQLLEDCHHDHVVSETPKHLRSGKVFIDWSQNAEFKTTVGVYWLRAKSKRPYVSTPFEWKELSAALKTNDSKPLYWEPADALRRIENRGDVLALALRMTQELPTDVAAYFSIEIRPKGRKRTSPVALRKYKEKRISPKAPEPPPNVPSQSQ